MGLARWLLGRVGVVACLALMTGCGGLSALPSDGGPAWVEVESRNFRLYSDLSPSRASETLAEAERLLTGLLHAGWPTEGFLHLKLNLVVLADHDDFEHFGNGVLGGYFFHEALFEPLVVLPAPTYSRGLSTLAHELTHYISMQTLQNQPAWLSEGLAEYYDTATNDRSGRFVIGGVDPTQVGALTRWGIMPTSRLMAPETQRLDSARFYPTSWLLVHYLMSDHLDGFAAYQRALGTGHSHEDAWRTAFGPLDHAALDGALMRYVERGAYANFALDVPAAAQPGTPRTMPSADVAALRALLHATCPTCDPERARAWARADVDAAQRDQPNHLRASLVELRYLRSDPPSPDEVRPLTEAHPSAWIAWLTLAQAEARAGGDVQPPLERALSLAPHQPYVLILTAAQHAARGERDLALTRLQEVASLEPTNPGLMRARARVLADLGECQRAHELLVTAANSAHAASSADAELQRMVDHCSRAASDPSH